MGRFIARRLVQAVPTLFGIMLITFLLTRVSPADPVTLMVGQSPDITEQDREGLRQALGLNDPIPIQFANWSWDMIRFDFGRSFYYKRPVADLIAERIPNSLQYVFLGTVVALIVGVPLGFIAALNRGRRADHAIRVMSVVLTSLPDFFLGLLIVLNLGIVLRWLPIGSMNVVGEHCTLCWDRGWHLLGPVVLAANGGIAGYPRLLRTEVLDIIGQDFVRTARAKGLREKAVMTGHVLRNALIPMVTVFGGALTIVIGGSVVIEQVFNWPGLGRLAFEGAVNKDYPLVQAVVFISAVLLLLSYVIRDIAYAWVDPRIKVGP